ATVDAEDEAPIRPGIRGHDDDGSGGAVDLHLQPEGAAQGPLDARAPDRMAGLIAVRPLVAERADAAPAGAREAERLPRRRPTVRDHLQRGATDRRVARHRVRRPPLLPRPDDSPPRGGRAGRIPELELLSEDHLRPGIGEAAHEQRGGERDQDLSDDRTHAMPSQAGANPGPGHPARTIRSHRDFVPEHRAFGGSASRYAAGGRPRISPTFSRNPDAARGGRDAP